MISSHFFAAIFFVISQTGCLVDSSEDHFSYDEQDSWPKLCTSGKAQSPIDLSSSTAHFRSFPSFTYTHFEDKYDATIVNNGHTVQIKFDEKSKVTLSGGALPHTYVLEQIHFHWHSEHTLEESDYPLEMHIVHYAKKYGEFTKALSHDDGIAVLGVWFEKESDGHKPLEAVFDGVAAVIGSSENTPVPTNDSLTISAFLPKSTGSYFRYKGSLTTPGCNENVIWTVFTSPLPASSKQIDSFRQGSIEKNYKKIAPRNGRKVYYIRGPDSNRVSSSNTHFPPVFLIIVWIVFMNVLP